MPLLCQARLPSSRVAFRVAILPRRPSRDRPIPYVHGREAAKASPYAPSRSQMMERGGSLQPQASINGPSILIIPWWNDSGGIRDVGSSAGGAGDKRRFSGWGAVRGQVQDGLVEGRASGGRAPITSLLGRSTWDGKELRDKNRAYGVEVLRDPDGVLVVDETGFLRKREHSVAVARQSPAMAPTLGLVSPCIALGPATISGPLAH
jgi:DDE superfamily endonuclease